MGAVGQQGTIERERLRILFQIVQFRQQIEVYGYALLIQFVQIGFCCGRKAVLLVR